MHNFRQLKIWIEAMAIAKEVYLITSRFPVSERYSLSSQMNRCSISVPSNIAEGSARNSNKESQHFLSIALGSLFELETQAILSQEVGYLEFTSYENLVLRIVQLQKMIVTFKKTLSD